MFLESLLFFHPSELTEQGLIRPPLPLGEQVAPASGRVHVNCCKTKLMKQLLFKLWSFPHADTGWLLPGHTKASTGETGPFVDELLPYKGLQRNQMLKDKKSFLWLKKGKVFFCTLLCPEDPALTYNPSTLQRQS